MKQKLSRILLLTICVVLICSSALSVSAAKKDYSYKVDNLTVNFTIDDDNGNWVVITRPFDMSDPIMDTWLDWGFDLDELEEFFDDRNIYMDALHTEFNQEMFSTVASSSEFAAIGDFSALSNQKLKEYAEEIMDSTDYYSSYSILQTSERPFIELRGEVNANGRTTYILQYMTIVGKTCIQFTLNGLANPIGDPCLESMRNVVKSVKVLDSSSGGSGSGSSSENPASPATPSTPSGSGSGSSSGSNSSSGGISTGLIIGLIATGVIVLLIVLVIVLVVVQSNKKKKRQQEAMMQMMYGQNPSGYKPQGPPNYYGNAPGSQPPPPAAPGYTQHPPAGPAAPGAGQPPQPTTPAPGTGQPTSTPPSPYNTTSSPGKPVGPAPYSPSTPPQPSTPAPAPYSPPATPQPPVAPSAPPQEPSAPTSPPIPPDAPVQPTPSAPVTPPAAPTGPIQGTDPVTPPSPQEPVAPSPYTPPDDPNKQS